MISLIITLFICLFNLYPTNYLLDGHQLDNNVITISKSAFNEENGEQDGYYYCFTQNDIMDARGLEHILSYFNDLNITIQHRVDAYAPIKPLHIGVWQNFDYASGYDWIISEQFTANYINVYKVEGSPTDDVIYYSVIFMPTISNPSNFFRINYYVSRDFGYMVSADCNYKSNMSYSVLTALYGDTAEAHQYQSLYDIMGAGDLRSDTYGDSASYNNGYSLGFDKGYKEGLTDGNQIGYAEGLSASLNYDSITTSIFSGIFDIGMLPVNVFLTIFNFELFGVNIAGIVSGLLTLSVVVIIVRMLLGGKKDD